MSKSRSKSGTYSRSRTRSPTPRTRSNSRGRGRGRVGDRSQFKVSPEPKRCRAPREGDNPCRIWVGGLDDRINDEDLEAVFKKFGELVEIKIRSTSRDTFAFVEFKRPDDAKAAMEDLDQSTIRGQTVKVNWAQFKSGGGSTRNENHHSASGFKPRFQIWVGRLNEQTTEDTIKDTFKEFGDIISMQLRSTSRDVFCFIEYDNSISCEKAIESFKERDLEGARLHVEWSQANNKDDRKSYDGRDRFRVSPRRSRNSPRYDSYRDRDRGRDYGRDRDRGRDYGRDRDRGRDYGRDRDRRDHGRDRYPEDRREKFTVSSGSPDKYSRSRSRDRHRDRNNHKREIPKGKYKIKIQNLPSEMTWMDLKTMGRKYGGSESVTFARTWKMDGTPMGLVEFRTKESMADVIDALDGHRINGNKIRVTETKDDREGRDRR